MLFFNFDKTHFIQFNNASKCTSVTEIEYEAQKISIASETKFLGIYVNNKPSCKTHIESIKNILNDKLNFDIWSELTVEGFVTHVPSLYLLSVTKENFLLKDYL